MTTKQKHLIRALFLAITAPNKAKTAECVAIAESLAIGMTETQIEFCKGAASVAAKSALAQFIHEKAGAN